MRTPIYRMTNSQLTVEAEALDGHECNYEDDCAKCLRQARIEREQDARESWDHSDARVRESVGNYR